MNRTNKSASNPEGRLIGTIAKMRPQELTAQMALKLRCNANSAYNRARKANMPVDECLYELSVELFDKQRGRCAFSGTRFDLRIIGNGQACRPFSPSLDRIACSLGYVRGNVRLVAQAVNFGLNSWGDEVLDLLCLNRLMLRVCPGRS